jgi:hypothetical protein
MAMMLKTPNYEEAKAEEAKASQAINEAMEKGIPLNYSSIQKTTEELIDNRQTVSGRVQAIFREILDSRSVTPSQ